MLWLEMIIQTDMQGGTQSESTRGEVIMMASFSSFTYLFAQAHTHITYNETDKL